MRPRGSFDSRWFYSWLIIGFGLIMATTFIASLAGSKFPWIFLMTGIIGLVTILGRSVYHYGKTDRREKMENKKGCCIYDLKKGYEAPVHYENELEEIYKDLGIDVQRKEVNSH